MTAVRSLAMGREGLVRDPIPAGVSEQELRCVFVCVCLFAFVCVCVFFSFVLCGCVFLCCVWLVFFFVCVSFVCVCLIVMYSQGTQCQSLLIRTAFVMSVLFGGVIGLHDRKLLLIDFPTFSPRGSGPVYDMDDCLIMNCDDDETIRWLIMWVVIMTMI